VGGGEMPLCRNKKNGRKNSPKKPRQGPQGKIETVFVFCFFPQSQNEEMPRHPANQNPHLPRPIGKKEPANGGPPQESATQTVR